MLSEKVPTTENCCWVPFAIEGVVGYTWSVDSTALVTTTWPSPKSPAEVAAMSDVPMATAEARPPDTMVTLAVVPEDQVAEAVRSCVVLSEYLPVACS